MTILREIGIFETLLREMLSELQKVTVQLREADSLLRQLVEMERSWRVEQVEHECQGDEDLVAKFGGKHCCKADADWERILARRRHWGESGETGGENVDRDCCLEAGGGHRPS